MYLLSFTDYFCVHIYSSRLANRGASAFYLSSPGFLIVGIESISILNLFLASIGEFGVIFSFSFDLCLLL